MMETMWSFFNSLKQHDSVTDPRTIIKKHLQVSLQQFAMKYHVALDGFNDGLFQTQLTHILEWFLKKVDMNNSLLSKGTVLPYVLESLEAHESWCTGNCSSKVADAWHHLEHHSENSSPRQRSPGSRQKRTRRFESAIPGHHEHFDRKGCPLPCCPWSKEPLWSVARIGRPGFQTSLAIGWWILLRRWSWSSSLLSRGEDELDQWQFGKSFEDTGSSSLWSVAWWCPMPGWAGPDWWRLHSSFSHVCVQDERRLGALTKYHRITYLKQEGSHWAAILSVSSPHNPYSASSSVALRVWGMMAALIRLAK